LSVVASAAGASANVVASARRSANVVASPRRSADVVASADVAAYHCLYHPTMTATLEAEEPTGMTP